MNPIVSKIQKMIALANDAGATEGERDNAMRMVHAMLAKHNLDINEVMVNEEEETREVQSSAAHTTSVWCRHVSQSVAKLFFCKYYIHRSNGKVEHRFVGKSSNVATSVLMSQYVIDSIFSQAKKEYKDKVGRRSFCVGAQYKIDERVKVMMTANKVEVTSTSVAVINLYKTEADANATFLRETGTKLTTRRSNQSNVDMKAFNSGGEFGGKVGLHAQMKSSTLRLN